MTSKTLNAPSNALYWQARLHEPGGIAVDVDDVHQAIGIILSTRKGEDPHRPEFGSDVWQHLDRPILEVIPLIVRDAFDAISRWEKRIRVTHLTVNPVVNERDRQSGARIVVSVRWMWSGLDHGATTEAML